MDRPVDEAARFVRACVELAEEGDDSALDIRPHFRDRMRERGLFWADVLTILLDPQRVEDRGLDDEGRLQLWLFGTLLGGASARIVCSIDWDTRLITINWE